MVERKGEISRIKLTKEEREENRREAIREATRLAIILHGDALRELERY